MMDEKRRAAAQKLLDAAHEFWRACNEEGQYGAVQWLTGTAGELVIFTRGEYRQQLMANINTLPNVKEIHLFGEVMTNDSDCQVKEPGSKVWLNLGATRNGIDALDWSCTVIEPCPFCGRDLKDSDRPEAIHTERRPDGSKGWIIHCTEADFGCGVEMRGDTEENVLMKWNRRLSF